MTDYETAVIENLETLNQTIGTSLEALYLFSGIILFLLVIKLFLKR